MADFGWLDTDLSLEWIPRGSDSSSLLISRERFAEKSGIANDQQMIHAFMDWTAAAHSGKHFCLAWDVDQSPDDDLLLVRYDDSIS